jgi:hypothetical protein
MVKAQTQARRQEAPKPRGHENRFLVHVDQERGRLVLVSRFEPNGFEDFERLSGDELGCGQWHCQGAGPEEFVREAPTRAYAGNQGWAPSALL